jgi:dipeptidase E
MLVDELEISTASQDEIKNKISAADYIFVEGENTFFLLRELKRTRTDKLIIQHINKCKLYIGWGWSTAGSIIVSRDIKYVKYMDDPAVAPYLEW